MRILWVKVTKTIIGLADLYRLKSGFMMMVPALLCFGCALLISACAHHGDDASADSGQHRGHHHGANGQGGRVDRATNEVITNE